MQLRLLETPTTLQDKERLKINEYIYKQTTSKKRNFEDYGLKHSKKGLGINQIPFHQIRFLHQALKCLRFLQVSSFVHYFPIP